MGCTDWAVRVCFLSYADDARQDAAGRCAGAESSDLVRFACGAGLRS